MRQGEYWARLDERLIDWIGKALRRKPSGESRVAAALLAVGQHHSARMRGAMASAAEVLIRRRAYDRPLYAASMRALAEVEDGRAGALLAEALRCETWGGLATLSAAAHCSSGAIEEPLVRAAAARRPEIAFGAELVRALRSEARRAVLVDAAARLKESARIELCSQLLAPLLLLRKPVALPAAVVPAMSVLRGSERHLGRWLVFALASIQGGDRSPLEEALERSEEGSSSARTAWTLLAWALNNGSAPPRVKPTAEIVARLSDRPTAERDMSFLFRLAEAKAEGARTMLDALSSGSTRDSSSVRALAVLGRTYASSDACERLREIADLDERASLRGIAIAGLWDVGEHSEARKRAAELCEARALPNAVWGGLVLHAGPEPLITERSFRYLERGWVE
jgi:hypothetical protein